MTSLTRQSPIVRLLPIQLIGVALILIATACGNSPTDTASQSIVGRWVGTTSGVRVELIVVERIEKSQARPGTFGSDYVSISGPGSLTIVATGESLPFTLSGQHLPLPGDVFIDFQAGLQQGFMKLYGRFLGNLDAHGNLVGHVDGSLLDAIGPLQSSSHDDHQITFVRQ